MKLGKTKKRKQALNKRKWKQHTGNTPKLETHQNPNHDEGPGVDPGVLPGQANRLVYQQVELFLRSVSRVSLH